jgi:hypothetical protein
MNWSIRNRAKARVYNEPIEIKERRHAFCPQAFLWHGRCYRVHAVERCWTVMRRQRGRARLCFLLRCAEGIFEVHQDLASNTWHLSRARWQNPQLAEGA